jgi:hypothetical protein
MDGHGFIRLVVFENDRFLMLAMRTFKCASVVVGLIRLNANQPHGPIAFWTSWSLFGRDWRMMNMRLAH